jgi:hypothetical protein
VPVFFFLSLLISFPYNLFGSGWVCGRLVETDPTKLAALKAHAVSTPIALQDADARITALTAVPVLKLKATLQ